MSKNLNTKIITGLILGGIIGLLGNLSMDIGLFGLISAEGVSRFIQVILDPIGTIFLRLLTMIVIPLIFTSVIVGILSIGDVKYIGKLGGKIAIYFISTTVIACTIGICLSLYLSPGVGANLPLEGMGANIGELERITPNSLTTIITQIVPKNVVTSMADGQILPIIFFTLLLGAALLAIGKKAEPCVRFIDSLNDAINKLIEWIMGVAPIGVLALIAGLVSKTGIDVIKPLAFFIGTVILGIGIHGIVVLPLIMMILSKRSPVTFYKNFSPALAMAFSTSSSIATLPVTMDCLKKKNVSEEITSFVCPIGATVNMDGTALWQSVTAVFIAQLYGIDLSFLHYIIIVFTATLASIGAAGVPSAGIITLAVIFNAVGLPLEGIVIVLGIDRILDMFRTTLNITSDGIGAVIIDDYKMLES